MIQLVYNCFVMFFRTIQIHHQSISSCFVIFQKFRTVKLYHFGGGFKISFCDVFRTTEIQSLSSVNLLYTVTSGWPGPGWCRGQITKCNADPTPSLKIGKLYVIFAAHYLCDNTLSPYCHARRERMLTRSRYRTITLQLITTTPHK